MNNLTDKRSYSASKISDPDHCTPLSLLLMLNMKRIMTYEGNSGSCKNSHVSSMRASATREMIKYYCKKNVLAMRRAHKTGGKGLPAQIVPLIEVYSL